MTAAEALWRVWYRISGQYPTAPAGKGTRDNPFAMSDLESLFTFLRRTGQYLDRDGLHDERRINQ